MSTNKNTGFNKKLTEDEVQWVVNDYAELGVKIGDQFFWLYKGDSLIYEDGKHDDGTPIMWRPVGKREFGECCHPVKFYKDGAFLPHRYTEELTFHPGLSFGSPEDCRWRPINETQEQDTTTNQYKHTTLIAELRKPPPHDPLSCTPLRLKAADEIERLRNLLKRL